jgi:hypothetical protein
VVWWAALSTIALINLVAWTLTWRRVSRELGTLDEAGARRRRLHLLFSGIFVVVCAFRSVLPRADVQKICLYDSFLSSIFVGRSVATVAELAFVSQWRLFLAELGAATGDRLASALSRLILPTIAVAEICSWYAVLTTNYVGNTIEESLWTVTAMIAICGLASARPRTEGRLRRLLGFALFFGAADVAFMTLVDVPMYLARWRTDVASGRAYWSIGRGFTELTTRWHVTFRWEEWRTEIPWMTLYFSVAVWLSLRVARLPALRTLGVRDTVRPEAQVQ